MRIFFSRLFSSRSVTAGAFLYVGMRWFDRLVGVVSMVVLARLLTPADFGLVALASVVLGLAVVLFDLGINIAVVQRSTLDDTDLNTAWSIRLIQNTVIAALLGIVAPFVAAYYGDLRLGPVLWCLALAYLLDGLTGMGPVVFQKRQQYAREVSFFMAKRLLGFFATLVMAFWLRSYWALVLGTLVSSIVGVLLSHIIYDRLPRFTLTRWRAFVSASLWLALRSMAGYATQELDKLVIGRRDGAAILGGYTIAGQIAAMPTSELLAPLSRALFPGLVAIKEDRERLRRMFLTALGIQSALALPASIGLALVASDLVPVILGEKWIEIVPVMVALSLASAAYAVTQSCGYLLTTLGQYRDQSLLQWFMLVALAVLIIGVFPDAGAQEIAWIRVGLGASSILLIVAMAVRALPNISFLDIAKEIHRPVIAVLVMAACVEVAGSVITELGELWTLVAKISIGATAYSVTLLIVWRLENYPDGAESAVLSQLNLAFGRRRRAPKAP